MTGFERGGHDLRHAVLIAFIGWALGSTLLRFIANTAPYMRDSIFQPVSQMARARSAVETFGHSLSLLSLNFHQGKLTGALGRIIDSRLRAPPISLLRSVVGFNLGPTVIELLMAAYVLTSNFDARIAAVAIVTIAVYVVMTFSISNWRIKYRRAWNEADSYAAGVAVDALMNYETIKTFGSEERVGGQYGEAMTSYAQAAVKANTSLQLLNAVQSIVLNLGYASIVCLAGYLYVTDPTHMSIGGITACILILQQVYQPLNMLGSNYREIRQAFIDMEQMINPDGGQAGHRRRPRRPRAAHLLEQGRGAGVRSCRLPAHRPLRGPGRCRLPHRTGRHHRSGRAIRRRHNYDRAAGAAPARPTGRPHPARRRRSAAE